MSAAASPTAARIPAATASNWAGHAASYATTRIGTAAGGPPIHSAAPSAPSAESWWRMIAARFSLGESMGPR